MHPITPTTSHYGEQRSPERPTRSRTDSVNTAYNPQHFPPFLRNRQNSNASMASSIYSEMQQPQLDHYQFTQQFDEELYNYYITYSHQPNITPFDTHFPPSGVLSLVSKLFLENKLLNNPPIQIDTRQEVSNDLLQECNTHTLLTILRLRLIHLCSLNSGNDSLMDQLPITRTNSVISAMSINDRVMPNFASNYINQSTDSFQLPNYNIPQSEEMSTSYSSHDYEDFPDQLQHLQPPVAVTKRERPSLNLNMPTFLQKRTSFNTTNAPTSTTPSARTPRGVRSSSITKSGPTYFNLTPSNSTSNQNLFHNPTLNHIVSPIDMMSPYEQSFPSPLTFNAPPQIPESANSHSPSTPPNSSSTPTDPDLYNATVARKRDSLRFKRGLN